MEKKCKTCKHVDVEGFDEPCRTCCVTEHTLWEPKEEKEEKKMDRRTEEELLEKIEELNAEIEELHGEIKNMEKYESFRKVADELKLTTSAFVDAGFTEEQAFDLLKAMIPSAAAAASRPRLF